MKERPIMQQLESRLLLSAVDITFPSQVLVDTPFQVAISMDPTPTETYDVKIAPYQGTTRISSEIFNGTEWRSTHYYLSEAFPLQEIFDVRISEEGPFYLHVKLRDTSGTITQYQNPITVIPEPSSLALLAAGAAVINKKRKRR